ncbi:MAG: 1,4-dihydroxy-2-naphthoate octaprenyltransferase [Frankiales bacterium]|jgi:1,4-dihydroxy-2-naphthoate octaprenyltransferase|nr:1,4-dihydroxy-2-naphthoate octaprenyltransferase [Frankiales bacterium]
MATAAQWVEGARPRTLPAAVSPVVAGTGAAAALSSGLDLPRALLALVVALALQVAVNYANDYSDGVRGTDDDRVGPFRLTGSRSASPAAVRRAAFAAFAVAGAAGLVLVALSGHWWLLVVGAASVIAAWYYTGGRQPYGYLGLGEVFVFVFFGLVAVLGTTYTQADAVSWSALAAACGVGSLACAILVANNLRDVSTDAVAGKRTLAVRLGEARTRNLYVALVAVAFLLAVAAAFAHPAALLALLAVVAARPAVQAVRSGATGLALIPVLRDTGRTELVYAVLLALGLAVS